jgi:hypothetical protein
MEVRVKTLAQLKEAGYQNIERFPKGGTYRSQDGKVWMANEMLLMAGKIIRVQKCEHPNVYDYDQIIISGGRGWGWRKDMLCPIVPRRVMPDWF